MTEIVIPSRFDELIQGSSLGFQVTSEWSPCDQTDEDIKRYFDEFAAITSSENGLDRLSQDTIDVLYNLIANFGDLTDENRGLFAISLTELAAQAIESIEQQLSGEAKNARKQIIYFLVEFVKVNEQLAKKENVEAEKILNQKTSKAAAKSKSKKGDSDTYSWMDLRHCCLKLIFQALCTEPSHLWNMGVVQENYLRGMWSISLMMLEERPQGVGGVGAVESTTRALCVAVITKSSSLFDPSSGALSSLSNALLNAIINAEHMPNFAAEICNKSRQTPLCSELVKDISHMSLLSTSTGVKNIGAFIEALARVNPDLMTQYWPILGVQIDSRAYQIRSSLLHAMGLVISYIHTASADHTSEVIEEEGADEDKEEEDNEGGNAKNLNRLCRLRDDLLDLLTDRTHDVSPYTRSAVLKVWVYLLESKAVPVRRINAVAELAVDRLKDKTASVRKQALSVLTSLLDNNPFSGNLDEEAFLSKKVEVELALKERIEALRATAGPAIELDLISGKNLPKEVQGIQGEGEQDGDGEESEEDLVEDEDEDDDFIDSDDVKQDAEVTALKDQMVFVSSVLEFLNTLSCAMPSIEEIGKSKSTPELVEVVRFFVRAVNFNVKGTKKSLQSTFSLVWHQEKAVSDECLLAFKSAYLTDGAAVDAEALAPEEIASNLIHVCEMCDSSELASLEQIIGKLFLPSDMDKAVISALWVMALSPTAEGDAKMSRSGALSVLAMVAKFQPLLISPARVHQICQVALHPSLLALNARGHGMEDNWEEHLAILKAASKCLQMCKGGGLSNSKVLGDHKGQEELSAALSTCFAPLRDLIMGFFCREEEELSRRWFSACEEAMVSLFHIHPSPDMLLTSVVAPLFGSLQGSLSPVDESSSSGSGKIMCSAARLSRLLFVLGQGALCSLIYTERLADLAKKASDSKLLAAKNDKSDLEKEAADAMEDEMGNAAAADADHERIFNHVVERQLVFENLLGKFHPLIAFIVANEAGGKNGGTGPFSHPIVRETALLALCRYMCVSNGICEMYLPLLFTALEREQIDTNRTTVMIALADLAFRFPNALEPWTTRMYARLNDGSASVRYNTLMVLTHLILNDMIKVKGQVSHVVMCLNDSCEQVRDLAHLFFNKLAERSNNPVYNLLGDIIATLSRDKRSDATTALPVAPDTVTNPETALESQMGALRVDDVILSEVVTVAAVDVDESSLPQRTLSSKEFQMTLKFLLSFVKKDKQADGLFERLLTRLGLAQTSTQKRNLAFCISELPVSPKGLKKLVELFKHVKDALHDPQVFKYIQDTATKAKKAISAKSGTGTGTGGEAEGEKAEEPEPTPVVNIGEMKGVFDEVDALMRELGTVKDTMTSSVEKDDDNEEEIDPDSVSAGKKIKASSNARNTLKGKKATSAASSRKSRRKKSVSSDEEESSSEEEEEDEPVQTKTNSRGASKAVNKRVASMRKQDDDDEEEDEMDFQ